MSEQPQHLQALAIANQTRFDRSALRLWVKEPADGVVSRHRLADLISEPEIRGCLRTLLLEDFLLWGYRLYPLRRRGCYELADTSPGRPLGALSARQRRIIADALRMPNALLEEERKLHEWRARQAKKAAA